MAGYYSAILCFLGFATYIPVILFYFSFKNISSDFGKILLIGGGIPASLILFHIILGIFSLPFQKALVAGKFPRNLDDKVYRARRLYGFCWNTLFYSSAIYSVVLAIPPLRNFIMHIFGYRGSKKISIAPDAWIRDLPLLVLLDGAYAANKSTLGTNICLSDGTILVGKVRIGLNSTIGHLTMVGPGTRIENGSEIGVGVAFGIRAWAKNNVSVQPSCSINHGAELGNNVVVGTMSYVGLKTVVGDNVRVPAGANIANGLVIANQEQMDEQFSSETSSLNKLREKLAVFSGTKPTVDHGLPRTKAG